MIYNKIIRIPVFLLFSTAFILAVSEPQSESSIYDPASGLLQSLLRKWQEFLDKTKWISKNDADISKSDLSARIEKQPTTILENVMSEGTDVIGSMVPVEEKLSVPQFLVVGRQQVTACTCQPVIDSVLELGSCSTTCTTAQTLCNGQSCTRTTIYSSFFARFDQNPTRIFQSIDETNCDNLTVSCILSSALATASSSSAAAAITTGVANVALAAGIAAGIAAGAVALGVAVKSKEAKDTYGGHYYETEYQDEPTEYYARRQSRKVVINADVNHTIENTTEKKEDIEDDRKWLENEIVPEIAGSIMEESTDRQFGGCSCIPPTGSPCSNTCYSFQQLCGGQICTLTTLFSLFTLNNVAYQYQSINSNDCITLNGLCSLSTALTRSVQSCTSLASFAVVAGALTAGLAAGNIAAVAAAEKSSCQLPSQPTEETQLQQLPQQPQQQYENQTPINNQPFPVLGTDCPDDECDDNSIRLPDGNCYPIFSNCNDTNHWVTFDNATRLQDGCGTTGKCTPRLCDDQRVFVARTGLCHDINDPIECPGGRRLYYTAFGDSICDCPIGQFPFPNPQDNCVPIFTRGPCPGGQVISLSQGGRLFCAPDECQSQSINNEGTLISLVPSDKGQCQAIGSRGVCSSVTSQFLGYDVFKRQLQCTNVTESTSPYFSFLRERRLLKKLLRNQQVENNLKKIDASMETIHQSLPVKSINDANYRRQGTFGLFQFPSSVSDSLLQPCRTGVRKGFNQKCTNPLVSNSHNQTPLPPVPPRFNCPANNFLQAGGQCVNDRPTASCGPSYEFNRFTGQCRPRF